MRSSAASKSVARGIFGRFASAHAGAISAAVSGCGFQEAVRIVECWAQHLAARHILEGRRNPPAHRHGAGIDRLAHAEPRQGGAKGAEQEDRFDQIAARLLDRQSSKLAIVERAFVHDAIDGERELLLDLLKRQFRHRRIAAPLMRQQPMRVLDRAFSAFDRYIHGAPSLTSRTERGSAAISVAEAKNEIDPARKQAAIEGETRNNIVRQRRGAKSLARFDPRPFQRQF